MSYSCFTNERQMNLSQSDIFDFIMKMLAGRLDIPSTQISACAQLLLTYRNWSITQEQADFPGLKS